MNYPIIDAIGHGWWSSPSCSPVAIEASGEGWKGSPSAVVVAIARGQGPGAASPACRAFGVPTLWHPVPRGPITSLPHPSIGMVVTSKSYWLRKSSAIAFLNCNGTTGPHTRRSSRVSFKQTPKSLPCHNIRGVSALPYTARDANAMINNSLILVEHNTPLITCKRIMDPMLLESLVN